MKENQKDQVIAKSNQSGQQNKESQSGQANQKKDGSSQQPVAMEDEEEEITGNQKEYKDKDHGHESKTPVGDKRNPSETQNRSEHGSNAGDSDKNKSSKPGSDQDKNQNSKQDPPAKK